MRRPDSEVLGYTTIRLGMGMSMLIHGVHRHVESILVGRHR